MEKHTKGPWKCIGWGGQMEIRTEDNTEIQLALIGHRSAGAIPTGQTRANAHLIAASPQLLEACKAIKHAMMEAQGFAPDFLSAAIAKAEGR